MYLCLQLCLLLPQKGCLPLYSLPLLLSLFHFLLTTAASYLHPFQPVQHTSQLLSLLQKFLLQLILEIESETPVTLTTHAWGTNWQYFNATDEK